MYIVNAEPLVVQGAMPSHQTDGDCRSKKSPNKSKVSRQPTTEVEMATSRHYRGHVMVASYSTRGARLVQLHKTHRCTVCWCYCTLQESYFWCAVCWCYSALQESYNIILLVCMCCMCCMCATGVLLSVAVCSCGGS